MIALKGFRTSMICLVVLSLACAQDAEEMKRAHLERGNAFFAQKKYAEAIVEYRNAIQQDDKFGEARYRLAEAYAQTRDGRQALREYARAADLLPDNVEVQLKAATFLMSANRFEDAKARAQKVLDKESGNAEALVLLGNALAGLGDLEGAVEQVEDAIEAEPGRAVSHANLASLRMAQGDKDQARASFLKAVEVDPRSIPALLSLANFHWAVAEMGEVEAVLKRALLLDSTHAIANRALATLYLSTNRPLEAEQPLKTLVAAADSTDTRLALADYYVFIKRSDAAKGILQPMTTDAATFAGAQLRLAKMEYVAGQRPRAHAMVEEVLLRHPDYVDALLTKASWLTGENTPRDALAPAIAAVKAQPTSSLAHYVLGTVQGAMADTEAAASSFKEALRLNPRLGAAQVRLSWLELRRGNTAGAADLASAALTAEPGNPAARVSLASALIAQQDFARADAAVGALIKDYPKAAAVHALEGSLHLAKRDPVAARRAFDRALELDRDSLQALQGLVTVDVLENKVASARARLDARLKTEPDRPDLLFLSARVYLAAHDTTSAERALRRVVEITPSNLDAYTLLARVYLAQGNLKQAQAEFDGNAKRRPKDITARTMSAIISDVQRDVADSKKRYREILDIDPTAAVAANNLAWIYADGNENLEDAMRLAETATRWLPDNPDAQDTLGWVYYRRELPLLAIPCFERSIAKNPSNPIFHYHLGLAYLKAGQKENARGALERALALKPDFEKAAEAREALRSAQSS